ncbi:glycosyl transferase [Mycolicibacter minnesotensis]|uniref:Glycosyl transferase n=1 Tax=Mycolicibacter minnesotensis TaxID=1118379 RepID=A0AA91M5I5_9MYCO|nr:glycosyltransferase family 39 protein [Mycolicibacter minnesotensis]ORB01137.1 glycosyl transferase [Mycolicibacter minnesotensis]
MTATAKEAISASTGVTGARPQPRWSLPALWTLLAATAVMYLWGLGSAGYANEFYAAAVQAGTQNWKALLFGSLDPGNAITVDKPPAAIWVMALSGRLFGFNAWSMLVPQALMGVASVALLCATVRRTNGAGAGLLAGAALALTPVAAVMFRFNNPDALLVLLLVVAAYCVVRALDGSPNLWLAASGAALGLAFLTKLLQAFLVAPALALVVLVAVPGGVWARLRAVAVGGLALTISASWFIALVALWPEDSRPYIGGSTDNSLLQLALGYNGVGRVLGGDGNPVGPPPGAGPGGPGGPGGSPMFGGDAGFTRMFSESMGTEISWLLPAALVGLIAGLWMTRSAPRSDRTRAALLLWGGWGLVTAGVFSFMRGIIHPYYTVALAPAVAAVTAIAVRELWRRRRFGAARAALAAMLAGTGVWSFVLLDRTPEWIPWLRWLLLVGAVLVALALACGGYRTGRVAVITATAGLLIGVGGTAAYTLETISVDHGGPIPTSGPARPDGDRPPGLPPGPFTPADNPALDALLSGTDNRWAAATVGSHLASSLELRTTKSVMAIGGFSGGDGSPTLAQFQRYVADHQIRYFIEGHGPGGPGGPAAPAMPAGRSGSVDSVADQITAWVKTTFTAEQVGDVTVYDVAP